MCKQLDVKCHIVSPENHRAILCERFHKHLNKVQRLHAADCSSITEWAMGTLFALYAWNASPIDGTNIIRSFAAKGRDFPFPIDLADTNCSSRECICQGDQVLQHADSIFPLLHHQRTLLKILNEQRRQLHLDLKNKFRKDRTFAPGDMVLVRKQVQSKDGVPSKILLRSKGPYRVIEQHPDSKNSYNLQKTPFLQHTGSRPGKMRKESSARMEKLPSTLICHKKADGTDTRLASSTQPQRRSRGRLLKPAVCGSQNIILRTQRPVMSPIL